MDNGGGEAGGREPAAGDQARGPFEPMPLDEALAVMHIAMHGGLADRLLPATDPVRGMVTSYFKSSAVSGRGALPHRDERADWSFTTVTCASGTKLYALDGWSQTGVPDSPTSHTVFFLYRGDAAVKEYIFDGDAWQEASYAVPTGNPDKLFAETVSRLGAPIDVVDFAE